MASINRSLYFRARMLKNIQDLTVSYYRLQIR